MAGGEEQRAEGAAEARARREREEKATALAVDTAVKEERVRLKLEDHSNAIKELRAGQAQTTHSLADLKAGLHRLEDSFAKSQAIGQALADAATRAASGTVSSRQFYVALGMLLVAIVGVILGVNVK